MALCCWTQAQVGGYSVCTLIRRWINAQYTSFSYLEKPVLGKKKGTSVTGTTAREGQVWEGINDKVNWPEGNSTLAKGWSLFLFFEMSSFVLFSLLLSWTTCFFTVLFSDLFCLSSHFIFDFSLCSSALFLNISCMKQKTIMFSQEVSATMMAPKWFWDERNYSSTPGKRSLAKISKLLRGLKGKLEIWIKVFYKNV